MISQLDQLGERAIGRGARNFEALLAHLIAIFHVELITMPMALEHFVTSVNFFSESTVLNFGWPRSQAHARAFVGHVALLIEQTNHRIGRGLIKLRAVSVGDSANVARKLNCR